MYTRIFICLESNLQKKQPNLKKLRNLYHLALIIKLRKNDNQSKLHIKKTKILYMELTNRQKLHEIKEFCWAEVCLKSLNQMKTYTEWIFPVNRQFAEKESAKIFKKSLDVIIKQNKKLSRFISNFEVTLLLWKKIIKKNSSQKKKNPTMF